MFIGYKAIAQGSDHTRDGKNIPCQDAASFAIIEFGKDACESAAVAVVADGHGSPAYFRSRFGAAIAVQIAKNTVYQFINKLAAPFAAKEEDTIKAALKDLEKVIYVKWQDSVLEHFKNNKLTSDEMKHCEKHGIHTNGITVQEKFIMYGTTLVAAVIAKDFWFMIQLGDGWCVVFDQSGTGKGALPYSHNSDSKTDSLCQSDALNSFKHHFGLEKIAGAMVMTDGISESFSEDRQENEQLLLDWLNSTVYPFFIEEPLDFEEELQKVIKNRQKRWGDDGSIAGVFDYGIAAKMLAEHGQKQFKENAKSEADKLMHCYKELKEMYERETGKTVYTNANDEPVSPAAVSPPITPNFNSQEEDR
jgi:hypothetical protein